eukprot:scaffold1605_cov158-Amphora_coffeaeformis.AAC.16
MGKLANLLCAALPTAYSQQAGLASIWTALEEGMRVGGLEQYKRQHKGPMYLHSQMKWNLKVLQLRQRTGFIMCCNQY